MLTTYIYEIFACNPYKIDNVFARIRVFYITAVTRRIY